MGNVHGRVNHLAEQLAMRRTDLTGKMHISSCNPSKTRQDCRNIAKLTRDNNRATTINDDGDNDSADDGGREPSPPSMRITRSQASRVGQSSGRSQQVMRRGRSMISSANLDHQHSNGSRPRNHHPHRLRRSARIAGSIAAATGGSVRVVSPSLVSSHGSSSRLACVRRSMRLRQADRRPSTNERS